FKTSEGAISSYEDKAEGLAKALEKAGKVLEQYSTKLDKLKSRITENVADHSKLIDKQNELTQALSKAQSEFNQLSAEQQKNSTEGKELSSTIRKLEQELNKTNTAIDKNETEYNQLQREINEIETKAESFEQKVNSLQRELNTFNTDRATNELEQLNKTENLENFANGLQNAGQMAKDTGKKIIGAYGEIIGKGSELNSQTQQTEFLYNRLPKSTQEVIEAKQREAKALGLTEKQYRDNMVAVGTYAQGIGLTGKTLDDFIEKNSQLVADMSSFADVPMADALGDFKSAMMGNFEAMDKYGVNLSVAVIENSKFTKSLGKSWSKMTEQEKALAVQNTLLEKTAHLEGFASSEAEQFATKSRMLKESLGELIEQAFEQLEPVLTPAINKMQEMTSTIREWMSNNPKLAQTLLLIGGAVGILLTALGSLAMPLASIMLLSSSLSGATAGLGLALTNLGTTIGGILGTSISPFVLALSSIIAVVASVALAITLAWDDIKASTQYVIE
ncbi:MAG: hypothetical protein E6789_09010, partial [Clostridium baratii]|nr:hypothetical protein [Clostridium baratii]